MYTELIPVSPFTLQEQFYGGVFVIKFSGKSWPDTNVIFPLTEIQT